MNRGFTPETLVSLLSAIDRAELDLVLVGGQSINLWANYYANRVPELRGYIPFASEDLDFYGGKVEAIAGIEIESAIPLLSEVGIIDRKWDNFGSVRLPQIRQEIIKKRERYLDARVNIEARVNRDDLPLTDRVRRYRELKQLGAERLDFQGLHPDLRVAKIAIEGGIDRSEVIEILDSGDCISSWSSAIIEGYRQRYLQQVFTRLSKIWV